MIKYLFVYGVLMNNLDNYACTTKPSRAFGMKLTIHKTNQIPAIIPTYDLYDYVDGQAIKICSQNKMTEMLTVCDQVAMGFNKKIIQVMIDNKKIEAYAYIPNELSLYDEVDYHSYSDYKTTMSKN